MKNQFPGISDMPSHTLSIVLSEIERFEPVAYALEKEGMSVYGIMSVLVKYLKIRNGITQ